MKVDWDNWNDGGKLIFVNACLAVLSMFMNWSDIGIASRTGISNGAVLYLGFWVYPVLMLLRNKPINLGWGLLCAVLSFAFASIQIIDMTSKELFGETIDVSAIGAWVFLVASFFLGVGIIRYQSFGFAKYRGKAFKYVGDRVRKSTSVLIDVWDKHKKLRKTIIVGFILLGVLIVIGDIFGSIRISQR